MTKRLHQAAIAIVAVICTTQLPSSVRASDDAAPRPNIILLLTDDQRWDAFGAAGNSVIETPQIDRLASEGVRFTNAFCTTSICATNRANILTGQYASRNGINDFGTPLSSEAFNRTFAGRLRTAGYRTGFVGKWGLGGPLPEEMYDFWRGYKGQGRYFDHDGAPHLTHRLGEQAIEFLDGSMPDRPFCLQVSFKAPHVQDGDPWPFQPDPRYNDRYADETIPRPPAANEAAFAALPDFLQTSEGRVRWEQRFADEAMFQKSVKDYYRLIAGVDDVLGRIRTKLAEADLADETIIIFTSDNGFFLGDYGLAGKWLMYEESIHVPLVIFDPRLPADLRGTTRDEMVLSIDIAPTIVELAGLKIGPKMQGQSVVPLLYGETTEWRDEFFYEHRLPHKRIPVVEGVRTENWKYVRYPEREPVYEQLFDLENDPQELENLAGSSAHAEKLESMRRRTDQWREQVK